MHLESVGCDQGSESEHAGNDEHDEERDFREEETVEARGCSGEFARCGCEDYEKNDRGKSEHLPPKEWQGVPRDDESSGGVRERSDGSVIEGPLVDAEAGTRAPEGNQVGSGQRAMASKGLVKRRVGAAQFTKVAQGCCSARDRGDGEE